MPLPEKEYFCLDEIEERWGIRRRDTIYYAENGLLAVAVPATALRIEIGQVVAMACGEALRVQAERLRATGPLRLRERDAATVLRRGSAKVTEFWAEEPNYCVLAPAEQPLIVTAQDLVVARDERDRFEQAHDLIEKRETSRFSARPLLPAVDCSDDGSWIRVGDQEYLFSGLLQKTAIRRLFEALQDGSPRLAMQTLLEEIESRSRHISQVFSGADPKWREIIGYGKGHVWLKVDA